MNEAFKKVLIDILKYSIGALLGFVGTTLSGCAFVPVLDF